MKIEDKSYSFQTIALSYLLFSAETKITNCDLSDYYGTKFIDTQFKSVRILNESCHFFYELQMSEFSQKVHV